MKKFFGEFKKFITRGNVIDMAVGVIVGSSFTAIVNGLSNFILKPIINWILALILGKDALSSVFTFLKKVVAEDGTVDLANSIYIDWGSFINAVINFFIVAFVLFSIVKIFNRIREQGKKLEEETRKGKPTKEERKEMKELGINLRDAEAVAGYYAEKERAAAEAKALAEEKARLEKELNPSAEELLKEIRDLLKQK
jgi:large conductance mechanosensitive channel